MDQAQQISQPHTFEALYAVAKSLESEVTFNEGSKPNIIHNKFGSFEIDSILVATASENPYISCKGHLLDGMAKSLQINPTSFGNYTDITELVESISKLYQPPTLNGVTASIPVERNRCTVTQAKISDPQLAVFATCYPLALEKIYLASRVLTDKEDEAVTDSKGILRSILKRGAAAIFKPETQPNEFYEKYLEELSSGSSDNIKLPKDKLIELVQSTIRIIYNEREKLVTKVEPYKREDLLHYALGSFMLIKLGEVFSRLGGKAVSPIISSGSGREPFRTAAHDILIELRLNGR